MTRQGPAALLAEQATSKRQKQHSYVSACCGGANTLLLRRPGHVAALCTTHINTLTKALLSSIRACAAGSSLVTKSTRQLDTMLGCLGVKHHIWMSHAMP